MKRRIALAVAALAALGLLTACDGDSAAGSSTAPNSGARGDIGTFYVDLPDGRNVLCVSQLSRIGQGGGLGLSCNWAELEPVRDRLYPLATQERA